jgi:hypothetical protein
LTELEHFSGSEEGAYGMVVKGWFKPARSGAHKFYVSGTNTVALYVGDSPA